MRTSSNFWLVIPRLAACVFRPFGDRFTDLSSSIYRHDHAFPFPTKHSSALARTIYWSKLFTQIKTCIVNRDVTATSWLSLLTLMHPRRRYEMSMRTTTTMEDYLYTAVVQLLDRLFPTMQASLAGTKSTSLQVVSIHAPSVSFVLYCWNIWKVLRTSFCIPFDGRVHKVSSRVCQSWVRAELVSLFLSISHEHPTSFLPIYKPPLASLQSNSRSWTTHSWIKLAEELIVT